MGLLCVAVWFLMRKMPKAAIANDSVALNTTIIALNSNWLRHLDIQHDKYFYIFTLLEKLVRSEIFSHKKRAEEATKLQLEVEESSL